MTCDIDVARQTVNKDAPSDEQRAFVTFRP